MSKVIYDMSMSLDGFVRASNDTPEEPLGKGGEQLHNWGMESADDHDRAVATEGSSGAGAGICGRRTYDDSLPWWKTNGPTGHALRRTYPPSLGRRLGFGDFSRVAVDPGECRLYRS